MVKKFARALGLKQLLDSKRHSKAAHTQERQYREWLEAQVAKGSHIDPSLSFGGNSPSYDHLQLGKFCTFEQDISIWLSTDEGADPRMTIGDRVYIGRNTYLGAFQAVQIGSNTIIGAYSYIISGNHRYERRDLPIRDQGFTGAPIILEEDVWLGTHVVVLPGVTIGQGAIIAAGSIVNKSVPPFQIWGGTPAKFLKNRPE